SFTVTVWMETEFDSPNTNLWSNITHRINVAIFHFIDLWL
ncbi:uncharacterized protein METZ01_LOCUS479958, partial [marine metagenome]